MQADWSQASVASDYMSGKGTGDPLLLQAYQPIDGTYDEMVDADRHAPAGSPTGRAHARRGCRRASSRSDQALAELSLFNQGVTFSVYSDKRGTEKMMPVCLVPAGDRGGASGRGWKRAWCSGCGAGAVPRRRVRRAADLDARSASCPPDWCWAPRSTCPSCAACSPPGGVRIPIAGIDLIRDPMGDVARAGGQRAHAVGRVVRGREPPGHQAHVPAARSTLSAVRPVEQYPTAAGRDAARDARPTAPADTTLVVLTPGPFNSAYFEHTFLARTMGIELVEPGDLFVEDDTVFVRTTHGPAARPRHLPPHRRRLPRSRVLPPRQHAGRAGPDARLRRRARSRLANAPGNGCADDKAVYPFVPDMIRYYLGEEPILAQVDTYVCARPGRPALRAGEPAASWWSRRSTRRAATAC